MFLFPPQTAPSMTSIAAHGSMAYGSRPEGSAETSSIQPEDAPPPYQQYAIPPPLSPSVAGPTIHRPASPLLFSSCLRANQIIGIYKDLYPNMSLALHANEPPIAYVSSHSSSRPYVELHSTGSPSSPVIATAEFLKFPSRTVISVAASSSRPGTISTELTRGVPFSNTSEFSLLLPGSRIMEPFEWHHSSSKQVSGLDVWCKGMKLMRLATNEAIAVFEGEPESSSQKLGKFQWIGGRGAGKELREEEMMLCVMSLLAVLEKTRRSGHGGSAAARMGVIGPSTGFAGAPGAALF